jgi:hypothetical protein
MIRDRTLEARRKLAENASRRTDANTSASLRWLLASPTERFPDLRIVGVPAPKTNPRDRALGYMMPDFTIALAIGLVIGFILGYGVCAIISYRRHQTSTASIVPLLTLPNLSKSITRLA